MTHDEYAIKIKELSDRYNGTFNQSDYISMKKIVASNLEDFYADNIENALLYQTCIVWQSIHPRTCTLGLNAKYKAVLATIREYVND